jgi:hypothetical protein
MCENPGNIPGAHGPLKSGAYEATVVKTRSWRTPAKTPKSSASVGISSPSSQANLPDLLLPLIFFILLDFLVVILEVVVFEVVVIRRRKHRGQGCGPVWVILASAVAAASPDAAAAAGFCAVGAGAVAPGVTGGGVAGFAPAAATYVVQK